MTKLESQLAILRRSGARTRAATVNEHSICDHTGCEGMGGGGREGGRSEVPMPGFDRPMPLNGAVDAWRAC